MGWGCGPLPSLVEVWAASKRHMNKSGGEYLYGRCETSDCCPVICVLAEQGRPGHLVHVLSLQRLTGMWVVAFR